MRNPVAHVVVASALVAASAAACSGPPAAEAGRVELSEWTIAVGAPAGDEIEVANTGDEHHDLLVARADGTPVATTGVFAPGETRTLHVPASGEYTFTCRVMEVEEDGSTEDHVARGMQTTVDWDGGELR